MNRLNYCGIFSDNSVYALLAYQNNCGEMPERLKGVDSKSIVPVRVPGVRIPLSPPHNTLI